MNSQQQAIVRRIIKIGKQRGAGPKQIKAALETGLVESNFTNSGRMTDHDSQGWRQERKSLYKNPTNLDASINRFFDETGAVAAKYGKAGDLAAAVQRPAAQYRGRYQQRSSEADQLLSQFGGGGGGAQVRAASVTTPGVDRSAERQALLQQYVLSKGNTDPHQALIALGTGLSEAKDTPATVARTTGKSKPTTGVDTANMPKGHSPLFELFWQGQNGINAKNGAKVPQGFVSGHQDHVHVAAGPNTVVALGRLAQRMGLHVGENPRFGKVNPVHVKGSYHYKKEAIDVSGDPKKMAAYAHAVAKQFGIQ